MGIKIKGDRNALRSPFAVLSVYMDVNPRIRYRITEIEPQTRE